MHTDIKLNYLRFSEDRQKDQTMTMTTGNRTFVDLQLTYYIRHKLLLDMRSIYTVSQLEDTL